IFSEKLNKFYVGSTQDLTIRLDDHNNSRSAFTKTGKPWKLVWSKSFNSRKLHNTNHLSY
ncbi:MAG: GIY-YIG nuclease family protein, partial [Cyclobacteriaceae bacterium]